MAGIVILDNVCQRATLVRQLRTTAWRTCLWSDSAANVHMASSSSSMHGALYSHTPMGQVAPAVVQPAFGDGMLHVGLSEDDMPQLLDHV
jgi:hypothetical protein